jgi:arylformamidase
MTLLSADLVERGYNNRAAFPDYPRWFARWAVDSAATRARQDSRLDVRYGSGARQVLDLFPAPAARGALLFIHGGYWRALDKSDHSFVADPWVARGISVAVMNYDLCPAVGIPRIVDEAREAVCWLLRYGSRHGVPAQRLALAGHSAGGHLVAMLFATDWTRYGVFPQAICGGLSVSGVFDLEPLLLASMNADLHLDRATARAMSPVHLIPEVTAPLLLAVGADETGEFVRQTGLLWGAWPGCRPPAAAGPLHVPGRHHFSVISDLADPDSALFLQAEKILSR